MPALSIRHQLFIDGCFVDAESGETLATLNPHDNTPIAQVRWPARPMSTRPSPRQGVPSPNGAAWPPPTVAASC
jgi:hypothetical protein